jgi:glycogen phosphorylase
LPPENPTASVRTGGSVEALKQAFVDNLFYVQGRFMPIATPNDFYMALAYTVRDRILDRWIETSILYFERRVRTVCYLSAEYLPGPYLGLNLVNLGLYDEAQQGLWEMGLDLEKLLEQEEEPGLGNGGLGRLAACFMDSLATLSVPAIGYGIRYEFGLFDQKIEGGWQVEATDKWLRLGNPWELPRPEIAFNVGFGGRTERGLDERGRLHVRWIPEWVLKGVAYDTPILGYRAATANFLRLWKAEASESFDFQAFNAGDYYGAVDQNVTSENLSKVLYPNDEPAAGRELRLSQQYFLVCCSLQDMIRIHLQTAKSVETLQSKYACQLNDTHPALAVPELMRLLVDEHGLDWDPAWEITRGMLGYTNHTLLPEALEKWSLELFGRLLPRHLEIVYEINRRFLEQVRSRFPGDEGRVARMSLIDESGGRSVRMAHLATVGSHAVNGVARLHSELLRTSLLSDFHEIWPERFGNKTNGVTPRRFVALDNPRLTSLISSEIDGDWLCSLDRLRELEPLAKDPGFQEAWRRVKRENKLDLAAEIRHRCGFEVDPDSLFDVHVKRIHEYKRQHLNLLRVIAHYLDLRENGGKGRTPRTVIFAGKAAPGYFRAKLVIKLIHSVAEVVNRDPDTGPFLKVVFLPDYNVKNSRRIFPAADLSEQISTAGMEASGTGNMKFGLNGALTIGTYDGANIEIREEVGAENFFLFGLRAEEVSERKARGYRPRDHYESDARLRTALDLVSSGFFSGGDRSLFRPLMDSILERDDYMVCADFLSYLDCQGKVESAYRDREGWTRMSILNASRMGKFSSDRTIAEYCRDIWNVEPVFETKRSGR